ncbi:hypothetical protein [Thermosulfurimonas sp. F29]|uniref:hypothetical protein n=1 Tax=Thermosulfurimonas sp. F29 TaxID=2867247 RepID=UPI001C832CF8|nr:hypothetical protein [Thermosulfurimonas sp. F29]MBX6423214.1 hypothetical protein [Thermosulfurimonas sp. F29]
MRIFPFFILIFLVLGGVSYGGEGLRVTNEMIYEKLLEVEKRLVQLERRQAVLEAQFREFRESVDKRFEQVDKRFEEMRADMNARFEQVDRRFEQLYTFLWIITGIFTALVVAVIGFALWDRRTTIRRAREEAFEKVEAEGRWRVILEALRELAREDRRLAEVLRSFGLL